MHVANLRVRPPRSPGHKCPARPGPAPRGRSVVTAVRPAVSERVHHSLRSPDGAAPVQMRTGVPCRNTVTGPSSLTTNAIVW